VIGAGYDLLELRPLGASLEEVFMELTRDEPDVPALADDDQFFDDEVEEAEGG
jgi:hypothetical protein